MQNLSWLRAETDAHLHTDLIVGLPGEDVDSFARGFNQLIALNPHEIQVGILKRLRGTPIIRHTDDYLMVYNPNPPYNILSTRDINFTTMQALTRFARYWDMIANSGRFSETLPLILGDDAFGRFSTLSDWVFATTDQTHRIALPRLFNLVYLALTQELGIKEAAAVATLQIDFDRSGLKGKPNFENDLTASSAKDEPGRKGTQRQSRHNK